MTPSIIGWASLVALALQCGIHPFLATAFSPTDIPKAALVLLTEATKLTITIAVIASWSHSRRFQAWSKWTFLESLQAAALPAILYAIQNVLIQIGYPNLDGMTFSILNQTKVIVHRDTSA